jgi:putative DNA primase/helicase
MSGEAYSLPDDLIELDSRWGLWRLERVNGRDAKVPYTIHGRRASTAAPAFWANWDEVAEVLSKSPRRYAGPGFLFVQGDGLAGIDLDDVLDENGQVKEWGRGIIGRFADTYMEISPSGSGVKFWARGSLPVNLPSVKVGDGAIELYDRLRYFTVTGRVFNGLPCRLRIMRPI